MCIQADKRNAQIFFSELGATFIFFLLGGEKIWGKKCWTVETTSVYKVDISCLALLPDSLYWLSRNQVLILGSTWNLGNWWEDENWEGRAHFSEKRSDCQRGIPGHPDAGFPKLQDQFARASNIFTLKESSTPCKYFTTFSFCPWLDLTPPGLSQWIGWPTTSLGWRHFFYASNPFEPSNKSPICTTRTV